MTEYIRKQNAGECSDYPGYKCDDIKEHDHGCWSCNVANGLRKPRKALKEGEINGRKRHLKEN